MGQKVVETFLRRLAFQDLVDLLRDRKVVPVAQPDIVQRVCRSDPFGNFAEGMLLASTQVVPKALLDSGYTFVDADISQAYAWLLSELDASRHSSSDA